MSDDLGQYAPFLPDDVQQRAVNRANELITELQRTETYAPAQAAQAIVGRPSAPRPGKHGTRLNGVPSVEDMWQARRERRFMAVSFDPDICACRVAVENIAAARRLKTYRGHPVNTAQYLAALDALEQARVPLRDYADAPAVRIIQGQLKMDNAAAQSLLRRLVDLRTRLGC